MHVGGEDSPQVITMPPFIYLGAMFLAFIIQFFIPLPGFIAAPYGMYLGFALIALSFALVYWAAGTFKKRGTNVDVRQPVIEIVDEGPFQYTRNPMYVGMALFSLGVAVAANSVWILLTLVPALLVINYGVIKREEAYLEKKFGEQYLAYKRKVRRWL
jgi:protein-S-isoprenylcysteine O-methyltransferase Ste14